MTDLAFHLAIAAAWSTVILVGACSHGATLVAAVRSALMVGIVAFVLSFGAARLLPETAPECIESTPTGTGTC